MISFFSSRRDNDEFVHTFWDGPPPLWYFQKIPIILFIVFLIILTKMFISKMDYFKGEFFQCEMPVFKQIFTQLFLPES